MEEARRRGPSLPDLPVGWSSFVDSASGRTLFLNNESKDVVFTLTDVFRAVVTAELLNSRNTDTKRNRPTPGVPVAASVTNFLSNDDDTEVTVVGTVY